MKDEIKRIYYSVLYDNLLIAELSLDETLLLVFDSQNNFIEAFEV